MRTIREREVTPTVPPVSLRTILVAVDGSAAAEAGLHAATEIARRADAALDLVCAVVPVPNQGLLQLEQLERAERAEAERYLNALASNLREKHGIRATARLETGGPVRVICDEAERAHVDLLVMTSHGHTGVERAVIGSVADGVARRVRAPVLMLRTGRHIPAGTPPLRRMLVALDGSPEAERVLPSAVALALACGTRLELLQVVHTVMVPMVDMPMSPPVLIGDTDLTRQHVAAASEYLQRIAARLRAAGVHSVDHKAIASDAVHRAILDEAKALGADAVALTSHGRGASRLLFGSVADEILRHSTAALLLVRVPNAPSAS